mgnify:CR=1 FL=1
MRRPATIGTMLLAALAGAGAAGRPAGTVTASYPGMTLAVPTTLSAARFGGALLLVAGSGAPGTRFGVAYDGVKAPNEPLLELRDATTNTVLRTVTVGDLLGRTAPGWRPLASGAKSDSAVTNRFSFDAGASSYTLTWNVRRVSDGHFPAGNAVSVSFLLAGRRAISVRARFLGAVTGSMKNDPNGCVIADTASGHAIAIAASAGASVGAASAPSRFVVESGAVALSPSQATPILAFTAVGTTALLPAQAETQARGALAYARTGAAAPQVVVTTTVDRPSASRGDTVTYTIDYCNIGADTATAVELGNPIPSRSRYVEDSATGERSEITVLRSDDRTPRSLSWRFFDPIAPGARRTVRFKVIVV